jgi:hypothetical protein
MEAIATASTKDVYRNTHGEVPKLTNTNYYAWSRGVTCLLRAALAWKIVTGEEQRPEPPATASRAQDRSHEQYETKLEKYEKRFYAAGSILYQSCTPSVQTYINLDMEPSVMWTMLKDQVDRAANNAGPATLRQELYSVKFDGEGSIQDYISTILAYKEQLAATRVPFTDYDATMHILGNLPESWSVIRTILNNMPPENLTLDYVINALTKHEKDQKKATVTATTTPNAMLATSSNNAKANAAEQKNKNNGRGHG